MCVDESGQSDPLNATIFGPVVTAGGLDDGIPPMPIQGTSAIDVPEAMKVAKFKFPGFQMKRTIVHSIQFLLYLPQVGNLLTMLMGGQFHHMFQTVLLILQSFHHLVMHRFWMIQLIGWE